MLIQLRNLRLRSTRSATTPNLFILGAGKCGTTALYYLLKQHRDIHVSAIKEPSFFCSYFQDVKDPITYFGLFNSPARYRVDASHVYMSNPQSPPVLAALFPKAKFIVTLRDPKRRAYSLYLHMRRNFHLDGNPLEEIGDFESALRAEAERSSSEAFFADCRQYFWNFMYCGSSCYDEQLTRYLSHFGRGQFHFLTLAELANSPDRAIGGIAKFLGLDKSDFQQARIEELNSAGAYEPPSASSDAIMEARFQGMQERVDRIVGRRLDWSL